MKPKSALGSIAMIAAMAFTLGSTGGGSAFAEDRWVTYEGGEGPGEGKTIVLMAGDEEYRSEEGLPALAKILSQRHGFKCVVLFSQDENGVIDPNNQTNIPGMAEVKKADLVIMQFRFRELPDADMKLLIDKLMEGTPVIALRTSTHAFAYSRDKKSPYAAFSWDSKDWPGGFGQQVLGDTWVNHHGNHGSESTRGVIEEANAANPILRGVKDVWGPTDVYGVIRLKPTDTILMRGRTLAGMNPDSPPNDKKALMPLVWTREFEWDTGKKSKTLTSTIGAATDLQCEDLRRLFINACYAFTGLEVPEKANVELVGEFKPSFFGFNTFKKGVKVSDHKLP